MLAVNLKTEDVVSLEFIPDGGCVLKDWQRVTSSFGEVVKSTRDSSTGVRPKCRFWVGNPSLKSVCVTCTGTSNATDSCSFRAPIILGTE